MIATFTHPDGRRASVSISEPVRDTRTGIFYREIVQVGDLGAGTMELSRSGFLVPNAPGKLSEYLAGWARIGFVWDGRWVEEV